MKFQPRQGRRHISRYCFLKGTSKDAQHKLAKPKLTQSISSKMDKSAEKPTSSVQILTSTPPTDDESITTSTESDSFDTWTFVTDKNKLKQQSGASPKDETATDKKLADNRIKDRTEENDIPAAEKDDGDDDTDHKIEEESNVDELSDGISIISESDSAGRISPHPFFRDQLSNLNSRFDIGIEEISPLNLSGLPTQPPLRPPITLPSILTSPETQSIHNRRKKTSNTAAEAVQRTKDVRAVEIPHNNVHPLVRRGVSGLFFICVGLAVLAFIGKLRNPEWNPFVDSKQLSELQQKLTDMELQNNLMRAEIDILSKQVNYLTDTYRKNHAESNKENKYHDKPKKRADEWITGQKKKEFDAWSGIGKILEPIKIIDQDLHSPFECTDSKFAEVAGMCSEKEDDKFSIISSLAKILVEDITLTIKSLFGGASEHITNLDNEVEDIEDDGEVDDNDYEYTYEEPSIAALFEKLKKANAPRNNVGGDANSFDDKKKVKESFSFSDKFESQKNLVENDFSKNHFSKIEFEDDSIKDVDDDDSGEDGRHEHFVKHDKDSTKKSFNTNNSGERFNKGQHISKDQTKDRINKKPFNADHSNEEHYRSPEHNPGDHSKEHYNKDRFNKDHSKKRSNKDHSKEHFSKENSKERYGSGQRKYLGPGNSKNWYIERGDSREEMRHR